MRTSTRGLNADQVRKLLKFIDWVMYLPETAEEVFWQEIESFEEEKQMTFITTPERMGLKRGYLCGIEVSLELKFGAEGLKMFPEIKERVLNHEKLKEILDAIPEANSPEDLRKIWSEQNNDVHE